MIVIFGSSTDIGQRLAKRLRGYEMRLVSRSGVIPADLETGHLVADAMNGATVVVSCAHARYTRTILEYAPSNAQLILVGSAWRYSRIPNKAADQVREAEALFLASDHHGVMLHPTMIYGGNQENNVQRLSRTLRRFPFFPIPGGGRQIVCPIYIDDLADCMFAAVTKQWNGKHILGVAGPSLTWRQMVELVARSIGLRRRLISVPILPTIAAMDVLKWFGLELMDPNILRRFTEDVNIQTDKMRELFSITPREFERGIIDAITEQTTRPRL